MRISAEIVRVFAGFAGRLLLQPAGNAGILQVSETDGERLFAMDIRWPWKKRKTADVPDEMAAAAHAAQVAGVSAGQASGAGLLRERLRYTGKVQAVGFRFQAQMLAQKVGVTGWVKNLEDGDVLLEVEGTEAQLSAYKKGIEDLSQGRNTWIDARLASEREVPCVHDTKFRVQY